MKQRQEIFYSNQVIHQHDPSGLRRQSLPRQGCKGHFSPTVPEYSPSWHCDEDAADDGCDRHPISWSDAFLRLRRVPHCWFSRWDTMGPTKKKTGSPMTDQSSPWKTRWPSSPKIVFGWVPMSSVSLALTVLSSIGPVVQLFSPGGGIPPQRSEPGGSHSFSSMLHDPTKVVSNR
jgi:hypothetical protein